MIVSRLPHIRSSLLLLGTLALATASTVFAQGSLTPPVGPPAPTMKTLDQLEPRVDLQHAPAALVDTNDESFHYIIKQPGSYYLTGNIGVTKVSGIQINAAGVTLDLNGFEISRAVDTGGFGIEILSTSHKCIVQHGSIKGFQRGVTHAFASSFYASGGIFRDIAVSDCTEYGLFTGYGSVLDSCRAYNNSGTAAIHTSAGCSLRNCTAIKNSSTEGIVINNGGEAVDCTAYRNTCQYAITAAAGCALTRCTASENNSSLATSAGIKTGAGCTVSQCAAYNNASTASSASATAGMGIFLGVNSTLQDSSAYSNEGHGIYVFSNSIVRNNVANENGAVGNGGAGIFAFSFRNRLEGNHVFSNRVGIKVADTTNLIIKNSASFNNLNYDIVAGNVYGPIIAAPGGAAVSGNSAASTLGTTDPFANFAY